MPSHVIHVGSEDPLRAHPLPIDDTLLQHPESDLARPQPVHTTEFPLKYLCVTGINAGATSRAQKELCDRDWQMDELARYYGWGRQWNAPLYSGIPDPPHYDLFTLNSEL